MSQPVVVFIRHPDNTYVETFGDVRTIVLDLGGAFDVTNLISEDQSYVDEWIEGTREEISDLAADHPARAYVEAVIEGLLETMAFEVGG
jgi:hypothetical protein